MTPVTAAQPVPIPMLPGMVRAVGRVPAGARGPACPYCSTLLVAQLAAPGRPAALKGIPVDNVPGLPTAARPPLPDGG